MVRAGIRAPTVPNRRMGEQTERTPTADGSRSVSECQDNPWYGQAGGDLRIGINAAIVIEIDKLVTGCLAEHESDGQQEQAADGQRYIAMLRLRFRIRQAVMRADDHSRFRSLALPR